MPAERIMLYEGDNPLEMSFTEPRPSLIRIFAIGGGIVLGATACCVLPVLGILGVFS